MKFISILLLTIFCVLLGAQLACAAGWQVHNDCSTEPACNDHEETYQWDPCEQSFSSRTKMTRLDDQSEFPPVTDFLHFRLATDGESRLVDPLAPAGTTMPPSPGTFPLLN